MSGLHLPTVRRHWSLCWIAFVRYALGALLAALTLTSCSSQPSIPAPLPSPTAVIRDLNFPDPNWDADPSFDLASGRPGDASEADRARVGRAGITLTPRRNANVAAVKARPSVTLWLTFDVGRETETVGCATNIEYTTEVPRDDGSFRLILVCPVPLPRASLTTARLVPRAKTRDIDGLPRAEDGLGPYFSSMGTAPAEATPPR